MHKRNTHLPLLWKLIRLPFFVYIGLLITVVLFENQFVFQPDSQTQNKMGVGLDQGRNRFIDVGNHKIHVLAIERKRPNCFALYFHGNGGNIQNRTAILERLASELNITVLGVSYSGYGYSQGKPTEVQLHQDAEAALDYLLQHYDLKKTEVMVFGESLGGAVATRLASDHDLPLLGLDSTFASLPQVASFHYPWLPIRFLMKNRFATEEYARQYQGAVIQTHGTEDQVVPIANAQQLASQFPNKGTHQFIIRKQGRHNEGPSDIYLYALEETISRIFKTTTE